jgi:hypothetical protein
MRILGIVLVIVGIIGLAWGGITFVKDRDSVDLGVAKVTVEDKETIPIPPVAGAIAVIAGAAMLFSRRRASL